MNCFVPGAVALGVIDLRCETSLPGEHGGGHWALVVFYMQQMANRRQWEDETDEPGKEERSGGWNGLISHCLAVREATSKPSGGLDCSYSKCCMYLSQGQTFLYIDIHFMGSCSILEEPRFFFSCTNLRLLKVHDVKIQYHLFSDKTRWPVPPTSYVLSFRE